MGRLIEAEVRDITVNNERQCAYRASKLLQLKNSRVNHIPLNYGYTYFLLLQVRQHLSPPTGTPLDQMQMLVLSGYMALNIAKMIPLDTNVNITLGFIKTELSILQP